MNDSFNSPVVVGISQISHWTETLTIDQALVLLGRNSGNMMFTEALLRVLKNASHAPFALDESIYDGHDSIVLAAANWINEFEDFGWLCDILERTKLPVFLVGVGAQAPLSPSIPKLRPGTLRLLRLVADRSVSIAARGEFTCEVLDHYGIKTGIATGCPSLLLAGEAGPRLRDPAAWGRVVLHATRHGFAGCDDFQRYLYRQAFASRFDILLQSEGADIYYALGRTWNDQIMAKAEPAVREAYGDDDAGAISEYLRQHGLFYINYPQWLRGISEKSFCLGTRIHGTVASIVAGTPAVLIAHDSRTLELAQAMALPHVLASDVPTDRPLDLARYLDVIDGDDLRRHYTVYRARFMEFFRQNGLDAGGIV